MTEIYGLFDAADPEAPDRVYTAEAFARLFRAMMRDGIVHNDGAELAVSPTVPAAMSVSVGTGMALIQGRYYINDSDLTLNVEAADPSHPRIDRVVVRLEATPGRTVHAVVKRGTPAPSPVPPGLTRTVETWELSLAQVRVEAGATSILSAKITDERGDASLCGVAAPVYVPSSQLEVVGPVDMQGHALTGLPAPSGATDAARKEYVDTEIAGAIGGFGISDIAIDADKNWNGKSITNMKALTLTEAAPNALIVIYPSNTVIAESANPKSTNSENWVTLKSATVAHSGVIRVRWRHTSEGGSTPASRTRVAVSGRYSTESSVHQGSAIVTRDVGVLAGETVSIQGRRPEGYTGTCIVSDVQFLGSAGVIPYSTRTLTVTVTLN